MIKILVGLLFLFLVVMFLNAFNYINYNKILKLFSIISVIIFFISLPIYYIITYNTSYTEYYTNYLASLALENKERKNYNKKEIKEKINNDFKNIKDEDSFYKGLIKNDDIKNEKTQKYIKNFKNERYKRYINVAIGEELLKFLTAIMVFLGYIVYNKYTKKNIDLFKLFFFLLFLTALSFWTIESISYMFNSEIEDLKAVIFERIIVFSTHSILFLLPIFMIFYVFNNYRKNYMFLLIASFLGLLFAIILHFGWNYFASILPQNIVAFTITSLFFISIFFIFPIYNYYLLSQESKNKYDKFI